MISLAELQRTAAISSTQAIDPVNGHKEDDNIALSITSNRQLSLRELAEATGGLRIDRNRVGTGRIGTGREDGHVVSCGIPNLCGDRAGGAGRPIRGD